MRNERPRAGAALAGLLTALLLLAACGDDDGADAGPADPLESGDAAESAAADSADAVAPGDAGTGDAAADGGADDGEGAADDEPVEEAPDDGAAEDLFPDVVDATASRDADGSWTFRATLSSPYDTPERYADAWRVVGPDGEVYGVRELTHDHANEQPFTRSQSGIVIPDGVTTVTVEGRDQVSGWGGATFEVELGS